MTIFRPSDPGLCRYSTPTPRRSRDSHQRPAPGILFHQGHVTDKQKKQVHAMCQCAEVDFLWRALLLKAVRKRVFRAETNKETRLVLKYEETLKASGDLHNHSKHTTADGQNSFLSERRHPQSFPLWESTFPLSDSTRY